MGRNTVLGFLSKVVEPYLCKAQIAANCPSSFDRGTTKLEDCYNHFHGSPNPSVAALPGFQTYDECTRTAEKRVLQCKDVLTESCKRYKVRSFKTIRMSMEIVGEMIEQEPELKFVYLVRDPRGIVQSRNSIKEMSILANHDIGKEAAALCHRMLLDNEIYSQLATKYPHNILRVRYEDITAEPKEQAQKIYSFARNSELPDTINEFLRKSMNSTKEGGTYGTARKNATATAYKWRTKLTEFQLEDINNKCKTVLDILGYGL